MGVHQDISLKELQKGMGQEDLSQIQIGKKRKRTVEAEKEREMSHVFAEVRQEHHLHVVDSPIADCHGSGEQKKNGRKSKTDDELLDEADSRWVADEDRIWADSLSEAQLDLIVSIKQLAMERLVSTGAKCLERILPATALRTVGIILEELIRDHMKNMLCAREKGGQSSFEEQGQQLNLTKTSEDDTSTAKNSS